MEGVSHLRDAARAATLAVVQADITSLEVDAVVNAANESLRGGGGVDGAIHRAAGPELLEACIALRGCRTGDAKITKGFRLSARFIIHTVGPVWRGGDAGEDGLLGSCYRRALETASAHGLRTVAFPAISTGVYGFPARRAAGIAVATVKSFPGLDRLDAVTFCCFGGESARLHEAALADTPVISLQ